MGHARNVREPAFSRAGSMPAPPRLLKVKRDLALLIAQHRSGGIQPPKGNGRQSNAEHNAALFNRLRQERENELILDGEAVIEGEYHYTEAETF